MKKLLLTGSIASLLIPGLAFAAYNDVTLGSSASIQADGQTINIDGDANVVESLVVNSGTFSFVLDTNSEVTVKSASNKKLEHNAANAHVVTTICETGNSAIHLKGASDDVTVVITPKNTTCPEGGGGGGSGGSGSGGGTSVANVAVSNVNTIGNLQAQLNSLLAQLATLQGKTTSASAVSQGKVSITSNLSKGSRGTSVKSLQQFLNTHGFAIAASGPGSPGNETDLLGNLTVKAIQKFQEQYNIAKPGAPGYGTVGPKTRAKINELSAQ